LGRTRGKEPGVVLSGELTVPTLTLRGPARGDTVG
jgi:hypothetical protein